MGDPQGIQWQRPIPYHGLPLWKKLFIKEQNPGIAPTFSPPEDISEGQNQGGHSPQSRAGGLYNCHLRIGGSLAGLMDQKDLGKGYGFSWFKL